MSPVWRSRAISIWYETRRLPDALDAEKEQRESWSTDTTVQSIFGASEADVRKLAEINDKAEEVAPPPPPAPKEEIKQVTGGLA